MNDRPEVQADRADLDTAIDRLATQPVLLVASDYDGTVAPIVSNPADAKPNRESLVALQVLSTMHQTDVALISGRSLRDLAELTGSPPGLHLVGSHGSEFDQDFTRSLTQSQTALRDRLLEQMERIAEADPGFTVESKPASIAFHYRNAEESASKVAIGEIMSGPAVEDGVHVRLGKKVIELAVIATDKGRAMQTLRHRAGASAALFIGDDKTDEDAFAIMSGPDVGVKVGTGESQARYRVSDTDEVAEVLARLADQREKWLTGSVAVPIEQHAMLSDSRTLALLTPEARVTWMCAPRGDSPALFSELLGGPAAGRFAVAPVRNGTPRQRYHEDTLVLRTSWDTITLTDYLDCSGGRPLQRAGRSDLIRVLEGTGRVRLEFAPRLDFGRQPTHMHVREDGLEIDEAIDPIVLRSPGVEWTIEREGNHDTARAEIELTGSPIVLELRCGTGSLMDAVPHESERRRQSRRYWTDWAEQLEVPEIRPDLVRRSAVVLKGLCYGPSGAIYAAGTTSLPEHLGGVRNWDYRYCWPRDAAMSAHALVRLGSQGEAMRFLDWCLGLVDTLSSPERIRPLYTVSGAELGPEAEIAELSGYGGSRPVRIGNGASGQVQLDVFGPVIDLIHELSLRGAPLSGEHWRLARAMVDAVAARWEEPDHGIWEVRMDRRHHVHSKVMCWLTVDRGIALSERLIGRDQPAWRELRDRIADDVLANGFSEEAQSYSTAYGSEDLDAATLMIGLCGLLDPGDERFAKTVDAIEQELRKGPVVYRYLFDDGLPGREGAFHICTSWLIESMAKVGRRDDARELFEQMCALAGSTGLLPEQWCPETARSLGNHPQAYSHLGLINAALALA
ncbi:MAG: trehalose-phosphatase [Planctomycetota bacterium]